MHDQRIDYLIDRHLDGALTAEEAAELNQIVLSSAQARARFWHLAGFHAIIREWGAETWGQPGEAPGSTKVVAFPVRRVLQGLAAAAALAAALLVLRHFQPPAFPPPASPQNVAIQARPGLGGDEEEEDPDHGAGMSTAPADAVTQNGAAVITRASGAVWSPGEPARGAGTVLPPGWLRLESGLVQIDFYSGARVILEGPAEFNVISDFEAQCRFGRLSASVPEQAHGFKVVTPGMTVVDLGTAFGCNVPRNGLPDVHVIEGRVSLWTSRVSGKEWGQGQAVRENKGQLEPIPFNPASFVTAEQLARKSGTEAQERLAAWKAAAAKLDTDPATLVHYTFEQQQPWDGVLLNHAADADPGTHGGIVGAAWSEGRWPGKSALEFKGAGDRVRLSVPGEHPALTYLAWVRVDSLPQPTNALLSAVQSGLGAADWELTAEGGISMRVRAETGTAKTHFYGGVSVPVISAVQMGRWLQLATVYDSTAGTITHYLDGRPTGTLLPKKSVPVVLAELEMGNWALSPAARKWWPSSRPVPQRHFVGRIDELAILSRAMSAKEIRANFEAGQP